METVHNIVCDYIIEPLATVLQTDYEVESDSLGGYIIGSAFKELNFSLGRFLGAFSKKARQKPHDS